MPFGLNQTRIVNPSRVCELALDTVPLEWTGGWVTLRCQYSSPDGRVIQRDVHVCIPPIHVKRPGQLGLHDQVEDLSLDVPAGC